MATDSAKLPLSYRKIPGELMQDLRYLGRSIWEGVMLSQANGRLLDATVQKLTGDWLDYTRAYSSLLPLEPEKDVDEPEDQSSNPRLEQIMEMWNVDEQTARRCGWGHETNMVRADLVTEAIHIGDHLRSNPLDCEDQAVPHYQLGGGLAIIELAEGRLNFTTNLNTTGIQIHRVENQLILSGGDPNCESIGKKPGEFIRITVGDTDHHFIYVVTPDFRAETWKPTDHEGRFPFDPYKRYLIPVPDRSIQLLGILEPDVRQYFIRVLLSKPGFASSK